MSEPADYPVLYVLMRNDLASLNAGKACAQATHAANQCVAEINKGHSAALSHLLEMWEMQSQRGFGTTIVVAGDIESIRNALEGLDEIKLARGVSEPIVFLHDIVHDDSYPLLDGQTLHKIPLDTCGYIFGMKGEIGKYVEFPLMP